MSENKKLVPKRRFKEFQNADAWKQCELGAVADKFDNLRVPITARDRVSGSIPYYGANGIQDYVEDFTHDGEFVLLAEDGANDLADYPVQYVNGKVWVNNHAHVLSGKEDILDNRFLMNSLKQINIEPYLVGGGRAKLNADVMMRLTLKITSIDEQVKIGEFFTNLDQTIAFQQRKLEKMKSMKSAYLSEMFPAAGERKPKRRFPGFTDDWKQCELIKVANYRNGKAHEQDISDDGPYVVVNSKFISTDGTVRKFASKQSEPLLKDEIAFVLSDVPNGKAIARTYLVPESGKYTLNQRIAGITPNSETYAYFLYILMNRNKYFLAFDTGVGQTNLSRVQVEQFEGFYPSFEEQEKIGNFFKNLDRTLAFQQQKLEKLQNIKKAYLNEMFI